MYCSFGPVYNPEMLGLAQVGAALPVVGALAAEWWWLVAGFVGLVGLAIGYASGRREQRADTDRLLGRTRAQVWRASVTRREGRFVWEFFMSRSALFEELFGSEAEFRREHPWRHVIRPEKEAMDKRAQEALVSGAPGYSQEFPVERPGVTHWLQEHVSIHREGEDRWLLVGVITDVTAMHAEQERLRERDRLAIQALARADCLLWRATVRVEGQTVKWLGFDMPQTGLYRRLFGDRDPSAGGRLWGLLDVPDLPAMNARSTQAILSGAAGYEQEFQAIRGDTLFTLHEQVTIAAMPGGEFLLVGVLMDMTALRSALEARKANDAQIRHLLAHADCLLWQARVFRTEAPELRWILDVPSSSLHRRLFGRDPGENPRLPWETIVDAAEYEVMHRKSRDAILSGASFYEQDFCARREGQSFWLHERVNVQVINEHEWYLVGAVFDVTALHHAEAALGAEKERLAVTLAAMSDAVVTTDREGRVLFANRAAGQLFGLDPAAVVGRLATGLCRFSDAQGSSVEAPVHAVLESGAELPLPSRLSVGGSDGRKVAVEGAIAPVHDPAGGVAGVVIVVRDVTERERLEQEISRATKLQSVGLLAGGIAHDFNNLLTVILGNLAVLKPGIPADGEAGSCLGEAERAVLRARDLTQQLLTFARGGDPVRSAVDLKETITEAATFGARGSAVRCEYDFAPDLWLADADRGQIAQVVQNLVLNSVQSMPHGGVVRISASNERVAAGAGEAAAGDYLRIRVTDTGCGIPAEHLPRIFDPYFTTKAQGSGLGLATVYSIVKKHKGTIEVASESGVGTTFRILLPAARHGSPARRSVAAAAPARFHGRILLMDDEEPIRKVGGRMLARLGLDVETAADGATAIELFRQARETGRPFHVVMLDLTVPGGMGGLEAFERMRAIDPAVRGIVSSGYSHDMVMSDFRAHGFEAVIPKPYRLDDCAAVLGELLGPGGTAPRAQ